MQVKKTLNGLVLPNFTFFLILLEIEEDFLSETPLIKDNEGFPFPKQSDYLCSYSHL